MGLGRDRGLLLSWAFRHYRQFAGLSQQGADYWEEKVPVKLLGQGRDIIFLFLFSFLSNKFEALPGGRG